MIRQFEIGKAYHVMKIGDDTYTKIAFIKARVAFDGKAFVVVEHYKQGRPVIEVSQISIEGLDEVFYLGQRRRKYSCAFFKVRDLECNFSTENKEE